MRALLVYWEIRYIDRVEKKMKDRVLFLDMNSLPSDLQFWMRYKIEAENLLDSQELIKYRQYFVEVAGICDRGEGDCHSTAGPPGYFEDDEAKQVYERDVRKLLGLDPSVSMYPLPTYLNRYLDFKGSATDIKLNEDELRHLRIFSERYAELQQQKIEPPGLRGLNNVRVIFKNSETELKAFIMLFRKLYSNRPDEPGSFPNVSTLLCNHPDTALGQLAEDSLSYFDALKDMDIRKPGANIFVFPAFAEYHEPLTAHDIIRLMLYTQYHHSPKKSREEELNKIRKHLNSQDCDEILKHVFFSILLSFQTLFHNVGGSYAGVFEQLCHNSSLVAPSSAKIKQLGLHGISTTELKKEKILKKYIRLFAQELWEEAGRTGTPYDFENEAKTCMLFCTRST